MMLLVGGCTAGSADSLAEADGGGYEERLQATASEFAYHDLLNQNLAAAVWERQGLSLRVPLGFQLVPDADNHNPAKEHAASREVLGHPLPGVLGMWKAELPGKDNETPQSAYVFVLSNHHLWPDSKARAMAFHQALVEDVFAELPGLSVLPIESDWNADNITAHGQSFTSATFPAKLPQTGAMADFSVFLFQHGANQRHDEIKAALVFVIPQAAELPGSQPDVDPLSLSAQTLRITPRPMDTP
jgi:hypothetical protein